MTIDLDELERRAKAAQSLKWSDYYPGQAPRELVDLRDASNPSTILALIERVRAAEAQCAENAAVAQKELERDVLGRKRVADLESAIANVRRERDDLDQANRDQREAFQVAKAEMQERVEALESAIRLNSDAFDESELRRLGID